MKYLRSYYNNKKVIMAIDGCQNCPLMRFSEDTVSCTCRMFSGKLKKDNVLDDWVVNYNDHGTIFDNLHL